MGKTDSKKSRIIALLRKNQGLDKFEIAHKLKLDIGKTQEILQKLQGSREVVSGLEKIGESSTFDRRYYLLG